MTHPYPWSAERSILAVFDANGEPVEGLGMTFSPFDSDRVHEEKANALEAVVDAVNATAMLIPSARRHYADNPMQLALRLSVHVDVDPQTHFGPGPRGIVPAPPAEKET